MLSVVVSTATDQVRVHDLEDDDAVATTTDLDASDLVDFVRERERPSDAPPPRWVWSDTATWYPPLLAAGVTVARCWDLRLNHAILRASALTARTPFASAPASAWDQPRTQTAPDRLFDLEPPVRLDPLEELRRQRRTVAAAVDLTGKPSSGRLSLLLAAESAGSLVAAEMTHAGVPWDAVEHDRILAGVLGKRPVAGYRPALLEAKLAEVRTALGVGDINPDSPGEQIGRASCRERVF